MKLDQWRGSWVCFLISPFLFYQLRKNKSNGWEHSNGREVFLGRIQTMQETTQGAPKQDGEADLQASWEILSWSYVSEEKNGACRKVDALLQEPVRTRGDKKRQVERHSSLGPLGQRAADGFQRHTLWSLCLLLGGVWIFPRLLLCLQICK